MAHLFILSGQSNMQRLDHTISFLPLLEEAFGKENVLAIHDAEGGQSIRRWYKKWLPEDGSQPESTGDLYDRLMEKVRDGIKDREFESVTFIWMQGERDACDGQGKVYRDSLEGLLVQLSEDLDRNDLNCVVGRLGKHDNGNRKYPHWTMVRDIQVAFAEGHPKRAWVDTDGYNDGLDADGNMLENDIHYSVEGYRLLGLRFAEEAIRLIKNNS